MYNGDQADPTPNPCALAFRGQSQLRMFPLSDLLLRRQSVITGARDVEFSLCHTGLP